MGGPQRISTRRKGMKWTMKKFLEEVKIVMGRDQNILGAPNIGAPNIEKLEVLLN